VYFGTLVGQDGEIGSFVGIGLMPAVQFIGSLNVAQGTLFPEIVSHSESDASSSTFVDNLRLPVHRWIRFSAGFSGAWARATIEIAKSKRETRVFDPFNGSGTTLIAAEDAGVPACGIEAHPFVFRLAQAKLARRSSIPAFREKLAEIRNRADQLTPDLGKYTKLVRACYTDETLCDLDRLRAAVESANDRTNAAQLAWLALVGILRRCSHAGTAQWQYVLPKKSKKQPAAPLAAFDAMSRVMLVDMAKSARLSAPAAELFPSDARTCAGIADGFATLVVSSPPYPNNYDYADATRLEMCFFQEISGWGDLQSAVRRHLVRSCTQHVPERAVNLAEIIADPILEPIRADLGGVCDALAAIRLTKGGKKTYHLMVACYFLDLARVWLSLRRVCDSPSDVCFVMGDSAPYGIYVPVMDWLGRLALAAGFKSFRFERTRDRNVKWKNRKHRVPLCEGRLWVEG